MSKLLNTRGRDALLIGAAVLGFSVCATAALAQSVPEGTPQTENTAPTKADPYGSVVVTTPRTVEKNEDGVQLQEVKMSVHVPFNDLDMQTPDGVSELNKRVTKAADYVCKKLEFLYPQGQPETFDCTKNAVSDAEPQIIKARAVVTGASPRATPATVSTSRPLP